MNDARIVKKWALMETMLFQAAAFLDKPEMFKLDTQDLAGYRVNLREEELKAAMLNLELLAKENGCKSGFWRRLKKAAMQIDDHIKAVEYESEFHIALANN